MKRLAALAIGTTVLCAGPRELGLAEYQAAIEARRLPASRFRIATAIDSSPPESFRIQGANIVGGDLRGLMYGLFEAARQIRESGRLRSMKQSATLPIRAVRIDASRLPRGEDLDRFLRLLAESRINTLSVKGEKPSDLRTRAAQYGIRVNGDEHLNLWTGDPPEPVDRLFWGDPFYLRRLVPSLAVEEKGGFEIEARMPFDQHWLYYLLWGRLGYDPGEADSVWLPRFKVRFGDAAGDVWEAVSHASRVQHLAPESRLIAAPAEAVRARLDRAGSARITPLDLAQAFQETSIAAEQAARRVDVALGEQHSAWNTLAADIRAWVAYGRYRGRRIFAEDFQELYRQTGSDSAYFGARREFLAAAGQREILEKLGIAVDPLPAPGPEPEQTGPPSLWPLRVPRPEIAHTPPRDAWAGRPLALSLRVWPVRDIAALRLWWRDGDSWEMAEQPPARPVFVVNPSSRLIYHFEVVPREGTGWYYPDPMTSAPYLRVPVHGTSSN